MAQFKNYSAVISDTEATIYTVPASTSAIVIGMRISNIHVDSNGDPEVDSNGDPVDVTVHVKANGRTFVSPLTPIPFGGALEALAGSKLALEAGQTITIEGAINGAAEVILSVLEV